MTYIEASNKIKAWCLDQTEPFTTFDMYRGTADIVEQCEASKEDVVTRAFSALRSTNMVVHFGDPRANAQKYISAAMLEAMNKRSATEQEGAEANG